MKRMLLTLLAAFGLTVPTLRAQGETAVAKIGDTQYSTLQAAIDAAKADDTIILLRQTAGFKVGKPVTIEGTGNTRISVTGAVTLGGPLGKVTFRNLSFDGASTFGLYGDANTYGGLELTLVNCAFTKAAGNCVYIAPEIASLTVEECEFTAPEGETYSSQYLVWPWRSKVITITGSTFNGQGNTRGAIHLGDGHSEGTTATINENTFIGFERGIQLAMTNDGVKNAITISGNTFKDIARASNSTKLETEVGTVFVHEYQKRGTTTLTYSNNTLENAKQAFYSENGFAKSALGITIAEDNTLGGAEPYVQKEITGVTIPENYKYDANVYANATSAFIASFPEGKTVYDGTTYYATMDEAVKAIHTLRDRRTLWCKPGADVGLKARGHVCLDLTVYGNGASAGSTFELDVYRCNASGTASGGVETVCPGYADDPTDTTSTGLKNDVTLKVYALHGIGVWGQRASAQKLTIVLEDCQNVRQVMLRGSTTNPGTHDITLRKCTFLGAAGSDAGTVHCIYAGTLLIEDCRFEGVACPININNKCEGDHFVTIRDCTFVDCATETVATGSFLTYAAPIRAVTAVEKATVTLTVGGCVFSYDGGAKSVNGDILLGDGRVGQTSHPNVTATIVNTAASVQVQQPGDRTATESHPTRVVDVVKGEEATTITNVPPAVAAIGDTTYATLQAAISAAQTGDTVTLLMDVTIPNGTTVTVANGAVVTLDLNGCTITEESVAARNIRNDGTLTIRDSSEAKSGKITNTVVGEPGQDGCYGLIDNYGTLTIESGNFVDVAHGNASSIRNRKTATLVINGGTFINTADDSEAQGSVYTGGGNAFVYSDGKNVLVTGGTFTMEKIKYTPAFKIVYADSLSPGKCTIENATIRTYQSSALEAAGGTVTIKDADIQVAEANSYYGTALAVSNRGVINVEGGTFTGYKYGAYVYNSGGTFNINGGTFTAETVLVAQASNGVTATVNVTGGTFTGKILESVQKPGSTAEVLLSGGTFSGEEKVADYVAPSAKAIANVEAGNYTVAPRDGTEPDTVAKNGDDYYNSLQAAIDAAQNGETVTLLMDYAIPARTDVEGDWRAVRVDKSDLTLDLNGKTLTGIIWNYGGLTITGDGAITSDKCAIENWHSNARLTIESGTFTGGAWASTLQNTNGATVTVNGGTFNGGHEALLNTSTDGKEGKEDYVGATAIINGGTFAMGVSNGLGDDIEPSTMTINGGTFGSAEAYNGVGNFKGTVTITGGTFTGRNGFASAENHGDMIVKGGTFKREERSGVAITNTGADAQLTITGGSFEGWCPDNVANKESFGAIQILSGATTSVQGGTFTGVTNVIYCEAVSSAEKILSGGTFSPRPKSAYCAEGFVATPNADGTYDVVQGEWAAEVADEKYATFQEAVAAAEAATSDPLPTIKLLRDVVLEDTVTLTENLSIDLAGHTLYAPNPSTPAFKADTEVTVTLSKKEDGTVNGRLIAAGQKPEHNVTIAGVLSITKWTDEGAYDTSWHTAALEAAGSSASSVNFVIATAQEFAGLYHLVGKKGVFYPTDTITLKADIDLSALEWVPIASLPVPLLGQGHVIKGMHVDTAADNAGLFEEIGSTVSDVHIQKAVLNVRPSTGFRDLTYGGAFAATLSGKLIRCVAEEVELKSETTDVTALGGLAGNATGIASIDDCLVGKNTIPESKSSGAFVGAPAEGMTMTNCLSLSPLNTEMAGTAKVVFKNVYAKNAKGRFERHNTVEDPNAPSGELGEAAALNGIGWLLNGQKTEGALTWHVDSNENCKTLLPFATATVATTPEVELLATRVTDGTKEWVYANGSPIIIQEDEAEGSTLVTLWREDYRVDERYPFTAEQAGELRVVGGALKRTVASASITMKGGTVKTIYGGGRGASDAPAHVENTVTLLIEGGTVGNAVYGGGNHYAHVGRVETVIGKEGKPGPTVTNYVAGGANGGELGEADTRVDEASVRLLSGNIGKLFGGGQGYTFVGISTIEMAGGTVKELIGGGFNGTTQEVAIAVSGGTVMDALFAANRGTVGAVTMTLSTALNPKYGICLSNCLESNDTDGVVSGTVTLKNNAVGQSPIYFGATLGEAMGVSIDGDQPISVVAQASATKGGEVSVPSAQTLFLDGNVTLTVPTDATFTVDGKVTLAEGAKLVGASATSVLKNTGKIVGMEAGVSTWDTQDKKWLMSLVRMGDYYYASVAVALAKNPTAGTVVELLSSTAATDEVKCRTKGGTVTVNQGVNAYDVAELLGGAFKVSEDAQSLVYDYDLGVGGLTIRRATANEATEEIKEGDLVVEVTVKLAEGKDAPTRTLADCTLTVTSTLDGEAKTFPLVGTLTFTNGECKVTIPYTEENFPMGTNRLTVSISKGVGEGTP